MSPDPSSAPPLSNYKWPNGGGGSGYETKWQQGPLEWNQDIRLRVPRGSISYEDPASGYQGANADDSGALFKLSAKRVKRFGVNSRYDHLPIAHW